MSSWGLVYHWSCAGFESKVQVKDECSICPTGGKVVRSFAFSGCGDGRNIDSADHRSHIVNADPNTGACPNGFQAVSRLTERLTFTPPNRYKFAVDSFPGRQYVPVTDHAEFINVMSDQLMQQAVNCINSGRRCGWAASAASCPRPLSDVTGGQGLGLGRTGMHEPIKQVSISGCEKDGTCPHRAALLRRPPPGSGSGGPAAARRQGGCRERSVDW